MRDYEQEYYDEMEKLDERFEKGEVLTGADAKKLVASWAEGTTHGNYEGGIIYSRMFSGFDITIVKSKKE